MMRAVALACLCAPALAAQGPTLTVSGAPGIARYARATAIDTVHEHGGLLAVAVAASIGPAVLRLSYAEGAFDGGRHAAAGSTALDITVRRVLRAGLGLTAMADVPATGQPLRWWAVELRSGADVPIGAGLTVDAGLGIGPAGGINRSTEFGSLLRFDAGLSGQPRGFPVGLRLGYRIRRAAAGSVRDVLESVTLAGVWRVRS